MTHLSKPRPHLVERAVQALGGAVAPEGPPGAALSAAAPAGAGPVPAAPPVTAEALRPAPLGLDRLQAAGLVVGAAGTARSRLSEEMSLVHHQVLRTVRATPDADGRCGRIVLVTSARPGEGKTFNAVNLAASIAAGSTRRVVLVDADGKRGSMSDLLGIGDAAGLRLLACGDRRAPERLLVPTAQERLFVLPYGMPAPGGPEVPSGEVVAGVILRLALALPDHVLVVDSPPCLSTSDPSSLAAIAGQAVMVVEAERTQQDELEAALDIVDACPTLQLLLNRARLRTNDSFGAYGSYDVYGAYGPRPAN